MLYQAGIFLISHLQISQILTVDQDQHSRWQSTKRHQCISRNIWSNSWHRQITEAVRQARYQSYLLVSSLLFYKEAEWKLTCIDLKAHQLIQLNRSQSKWLKSETLDMRCTSTSYNPKSGTGKHTKIDSGLHGYTHEHISKLSAKQQEDVLTKSIQVLTDFTGKPPKGYTAPAWDTSKELIPLLEEHNIIYDHSFMHHDLQPYFAPDASHEWTETDVKKDAETWMKPMTKIRPSKVVEIPANWHVDDWPPLQPQPGRAGTVSWTSLVASDCWQVG